MDSIEIERLIKSSLGLDEKLRVNSAGIFISVNDAVQGAQGAYMRFSKLTLNQRQEIIEAIKLRLSENIDKIAYMTVEETKMGNFQDKVTKLHLAVQRTPGIEDLITEVKTGDNGMTLYELSPYGVVCAVHPHTNPCETLISNTIGMIAAGNSVVHCPHPRAVNVSKFTVEIINKAIYDISGIHNLVVILEEASMAIANEIMTHPDVSLVVTTGGKGVLRQAMTCGKKVIGAGPANPTVIVDETAIIKKAASDIVKGASFDNNTMCISEKSIVVVKDVAKEFQEELKKNGVYYIKSQEILSKLEDTILTDDLTFNKAFEGNSSSRILKLAGIDNSEEISLIIVETKKEHPFVIEEMLLPVLPLVIVNTFEEALETAYHIEQGFKHTAIIHSQSIERLNIAAKKMQTSIFVKNGPSYAGIGFYGEKDTSFTVATATGEGTVSARNFARRRRCSLIDAFSIR